MINRIIFFCVKNKGVCDNGSITPYFNAVHEIWKYIWNNAVTDYFTINNGVKQGGVMSPILFSLYLDQLISRLRHIGIGCHMNGLFTGLFICADDITLLAPSRASLALMLEQCESISRTHDILFNASKTKYMVSKRREIVNVAPLYFNGSPINCDMNVIYLV